MCCRVEIRRGGGRGREARECASLPAFLTLRLCLYATEAARMRARREEKASAAEEEMIVARPL